MTRRTLVWLFVTVLASTAHAVSSADMNDGAFVPQAAVQLEFASAPAAAPSGDSSASCGGFVAGTPPAVIGPYECSATLVLECCSVHWGTNAGTAFTGRIRAEIQTSTGYEVAVCDYIGGFHIGPTVPPGATNFCGVSASEGTMYVGQTATLLGRTYLLPTSELNPPGLRGGVGFWTVSATSP